MPKRGSVRFIYSAISNNKGIKLFLLFIKFRGLKAYEEVEVSLYMLQLTRPSRQAGVSGVVGGGTAGCGRDYWTAVGGSDRLKTSSIRSGVQWARALYECFQDG